MARPLREELFLRLPLVDHLKCSYSGQHGRARGQAEGSRNIIDSKGIFQDTAFHRNNQFHSCNIVRNRVKLVQ